MASHAEKLDQPRTRRRPLLESVAAASIALTGCGGGAQSSDEAQYSQPNPNAPRAALDSTRLTPPFGALSGFALTTQDGTAFDVNRLRQQVEGGHFTISFGFNGCQAYCPFTSHAFGLLDRRYNGPIKHIVINTHPESDGSSQRMRDNYLESILYNTVRDPETGVIMGREPTGVRREDVMVLYPRTAEEAVNLQIALGSLTIRNDPSAHSAKIVFYDGRGNPVRESSSHSLLADIPGVIDTMNQGRTTGR